MDAILVGIGTVLADDPLLTARPPGPRTATRIVLDSQARLPLAQPPGQDGPRGSGHRRRRPNRPPTTAGRLWRTAAARFSVSPGRPHVPLTPLLAELGRRQMTNLLVEGGGRVLGSFLDEGHVDEVDVYIAPILEGGDHPRTPARGRGVLHMSEALRLGRRRSPRGRWRRAGPGHPPPALAVARSSSAMSHLTPLDVAPVSA